MKLFTLFLLTLTSMSESKSVVNQFIHTSYIYNSTQCNSEPTIVDIVNYDKCNINILNNCIKYPINGSVFKTCSVEPILNDIDTGVNIFLTILIIFIVFLLYKMMCESELDNLCLTIKNKIDSLFCCSNEETRYINNYNSL
jgi:hypothetical protein